MGKNDLSEINNWYRRFVFYTVKLPLILITIPIGFLFDFLIAFPSVILCSIDAWMRNKQ